MFMLGAADTAENKREVTLLTPLGSRKGVNALNLGDLAVDPGTFYGRLPSL